MTGESNKLTQAIFLASLVLVMSFGGIVTSGMMLGDKMQDCPYMGDSGYCAMTIADHLAGWQALFATTLEKTSLTSLLLVAPFLLLVSFLFANLFLRRFRTRPILDRRKFLKAYNPLRIAFATGLIHSKAF